MSNKISFKLKDIKDIRPITLKGEIKKLENSKISLKNKKKQMLFPVTLSLLQLGNLVVQVYGYKFGSSNMSYFSLWAILFSFGLISFITVIEYNRVCEAKTSIKYHKEFIAFLKQSERDITYARNLSRRASQEP
jgi:hypothetical protein